MLRLIFKSRRKKSIFFSYLDPFFPKNKNKVIFVVKNKTFFSGNLRVTLEAYIHEQNNNLFLYKDGDCLHKIRAELEALGVTVLSGFTFFSIWHLLTSGTIILSHNPRDAHITRNCSNRKIINLWHGVAIKNIELLMPEIERHKLSLLKNNSKVYDMVIASSKIDKVTNTTAFGVNNKQVKITGLPRYQILKNKYLLGKVLNKENQNVIEIKSDKKLVLFAPTFREDNISAIEQISSKEWDRLRLFCKKSNVIFGIRPHPYDINHLPSKIIDDHNFHLFDSSTYTEPNIILKHTDALIVDFSSIWIDFLLLNKPIVGFAKDYHNYLHKERGFVYDFEIIFPSIFTTDIESLIVNLNKYLNHKKPIVYSKSLHAFHKYDLKDDYPKLIIDAIGTCKH